METTHETPPSSPERPTPYECEVCGSRFPSPEALLRHRNIVHFDSAEPTPGPGPPQTGTGPLRPGGGNPNTAPASPPEVIPVPAGSPEPPTRDEVPRRGPSPRSPPEPAPDEMANEGRSSAE